MKKPFIRVTKWLGDIPVEASCTSCPHLVLQAKGAGHRPNRDEYRRSLEAQFNQHRAAVHRSESGSAPVGRAP